MRGNDEKVVEIEIERLHDFKNHPFKVIQSLEFTDFDVRICKDKKTCFILKEQYNKPLMVDIGWISTQTRFFQDKTGFLIFTDSYIKVSKF